MRSPANGSLMHHFALRESRTFEESAPLLYTYVRGTVRFWGARTNGLIEISLVTL